MLLSIALTATDTAFNALDWTRDALVSLSYWQNSNSRRLIRFLESDRFHRAIRHTARAWVIACLLVRFVIALLTPTTESIATASDEVIAEMQRPVRPMILSTFTADCWPDNADNDLALLNGWEVE